VVWSKLMRKLFHSFYKNSRLCQILTLDPNSIPLYFTGHGL